MKISVIAIFYNSSAYIKKCIQSILDQQDVFIELIAVDDYSTDDTLKLLQEYAIIDDRIKIIKHQKNRGYVIERMAFQQNGTVRWLDPPFFLFLYTQNEQC